MDLADLKATARKYESIKATRLAADRTARDLKTTEDELHLALVTYCRDGGGAGVDMGDTLVEYTATNKPAPEDWNAIHEYIKENDAIDLVQKRLHEGACIARWDDDVEIPGVGRKLVEKIKVSIK